MHIISMNFLKTRLSSSAPPSTLWKTWDQMQCTKWGELTSTAWGVWVQEQQADCYQATWGNWQCASWNDLTALTWDESHVAGTCDKWEDLTLTTWTGWLTTWETII